MTALGEATVGLRPASYPEALLDPEQRSKLEGLERLWVAQLISPARYAKLRNRVLGAAVPSWAPGATPRGFRDRVNLVVAAATGMLMIVGVTVAGFWPRQDSIPSSQASARGSIATQPGSAAGAPAVNLQELSSEYSTLVAPLNTAHSAFYAAFDAATRQPCSCPPGEFDIKSVLPSMRALVTAYGDAIVSLQRLQQKAPPIVATHIQALILAQTRAVTALQDVLRTKPTTAGNDVLAVGYAPAVEDERRAAALVRTDLGLPQTPIV